MVLKLLNLSVWPVLLSYTSETLFHKNYFGLGHAFELT